MYIYIHTDTHTRVRLANVIRARENGRIRDDGARLYVVLSRSTISTGPIRRTLRRISRELITDLWKNQEPDGRNQVISRVTNGDVYYRGTADVRSASHV